VDLVYAPAWTVCSKQARFIKWAVSSTVSTSGSLIQMFFLQASSSLMRDVRENEEQLGLKAAKVLEPVDL